MSEDQLHIVFGTGQAGNALAAYLAGQVSPSERCPGTGRPPQQALQAFAQAVADSS